MKTVTNLFAMLLAWYGAVAMLAAEDKEPSADAAAEAGAKTENGKAGKEDGKKEADRQKSQETEARSGRIERPPFLAEMDERMEQVKLTEQQQENYAQYREDYLSSVKNAAKLLQDTVTDEQRQAIQEAVEQAKAEGKTGKELIGSVRGSVEWTDEQKEVFRRFRKRLEDAKEHLKYQVREYLLTEQQRGELKMKTSAEQEREKRASNVHSRAVDKVEALLDEINLPDDRRQLYEQTKANHLEEVAEFQQRIDSLLKDKEKLDKDQKEDVQALRSKVRDLQQNFLYNVREYVLTDEQRAKVGDQLHWLADGHKRKDEKKHESGDKEPDKKKE